MSTTPHAAATDFCDTPHHSASETARAVNALFRLAAKDDAPYGTFSKCLYDLLYLRLGFIAHFNRAGFYHTWVRRPADRAMMLREILEYAGTWPSEAGSLNAYLCGEHVRTWLLACSARPENLAARQQEKAERELLALLLRKYGSDECGPVEQLALTS